MIWPNVPCADCGAAELDPCRTSSGAVARAPHAGREIAEAFAGARLRDTGVADFRKYQERRQVRAVAARRAGSK